MLTSFFYISVTNETTEATDKLPLEQFVTSRGCQGIVLANYKFKLRSKSKSSVHWRCQNRTCTAKCLTDLKYVLKGDEYPVHNHAEHVTIEEDLAKYAQPSPNPHQPSLNPPHSSPNPPQTSRNPPQPSSSPSKPSQNIHQHSSSHPQNSTLNQHLPTSSQTQHSPINHETSYLMAEPYISKFGNTALRIGNFTFQKHRATDEHITWRCTKLKLKCKATCTTTTDFVITGFKNNHNHEAESEEIRVKADIGQRLKQKAAESPHQKPSHLISKEVSRFTDIVTQKDVVNYRKMVSRGKLSVYPTLPKSQQETLIYLNNLRSEEQLPLLRQVDEENKIIMFTNDELLTLLGTENVEVLSDGTFDYCPKFFKQLYTFHVYRNGVYTPVVYFLLPDKETKTYVSMFKMLKEQMLAISLAISWKHLVIDFEKAIHNAVNKELPNLPIKGCRFHLAKAWFRKIQKNNLQKIYFNDSSAAEWLKHLFAFPGISSDIVFECFREYTKRAPEIDGISDLVKYLERNYLSPNARFKPEMWADQISQEDSRSTTNGCESFHRHFGDNFASVQPNIFLFVENLVNHTTMATIKSKTISNVKQSTDYKEDLEELQKLNNDTCYIYDFVKNTFKFRMLPVAS